MPERKEGPRQEFVQREAYSEETVKEPAKEALREKAVESPERALPKEKERLIPLGLDLEKVRAMIGQLQGSLEANLVDETWESKQKVAVRDLADVLQSINDKIYGIVFDGVVTQRLLDISSNKGVSFVIGARIGNIAKRPQGVTILTFDDIMPSQ